MLTSDGNEVSACAVVCGFVEPHVVSKPGLQCPGALMEWGEEAADFAAWLDWTLATLRRLGS